MPMHWTNPHSTYTEQVMNRFHEVNELQDSTLNEIHHFIYANGIATNKYFTFRNAMKQDDKISLVDAMEK